MRLGAPLGAAFIDPHLMGLFANALLALRRVHSDLPNLFSIDKPINFEQFVQPAPRLMARS
jgi:hypothetical protein